MTATINSGLLFYALRRKLKTLEISALKRDSIVLVLAALLAGIVAALLSVLWQSHLGHRSIPLKLGAVFIPGGIAGVVYWSAAAWLKVPAAHEIWTLLTRKLRSTRV